MQLIRKIRFSMGAIMMFVLMVAAGSALLVKILAINKNFPVQPWEARDPRLLPLAIALTAMALGSWREHTGLQIMFQSTLSCLICLSLFWFEGCTHAKVIAYWHQGIFAATITLPMVVARYVKSALPAGPRRDSWKKTCEAVLFSFLTLLIIDYCDEYLLPREVNALRIGLPVPMDLMPILAPDPAPLLPSDL